MWLCMCCVAMCDAYGLDGRCCADYDCTVVLSVTMCCVRDDDDDDDDNDTTFVDDRGYVVVVAVCVVAGAVGVCSLVDDESGWAV
jgi:hypothetical protein